MRPPYTIIVVLLVLIVGLDLALNHAGGVLALIGYANAMLWKIGPI